MQSTQPCSLGVMTTLLVWAAIDAAFLCSQCSLIFVSALFFGSGHFDEEYWGEYLAVKISTSEGQSATQ